MLLINRLVIFSYVASQTFACINTQMYNSMLRQYFNTHTHTCVNYIITPELDTSLGTQG